MCKFLGCRKIFKGNGKAKRLHEASHSSGSANSGDMFHYQIAFLEYGMVVKNFFDAISEGDGERMFRSWKFMLLYLKGDGKRSSKYSLECMYLICQRYCLLSEQAAHRLMWNRFVKNKSGFGDNIPLDLTLEHFNRLLKNVIRMLVPNASNHQVVDRYCKALATNKAVIEKLDEGTSFVAKSVMSLVIWKE